VVWVSAVSDLWKSIWSGKRFDGKTAPCLADLIRINGFDTGVGSYTEQEWSGMVGDALQRMNAKNGMNILDIGCGSGAWLYAASIYNNLNAWGIDYSQSLVDVARIAMPGGVFLNGEALHLNSLLEDVNFDLIVSHSVFQYLPSRGYAMEVLAAAYEKLVSGGCLALMDLNDEECEEMYHSERAASYRSPGEYESAYKGLEHLFFCKMALSSGLRGLGFDSIVFFPHWSESYGNRKFRFNLIARKPLL